MWFWSIKHWNVLRILQSTLYEKNNNEKSTACSRIEGCLGSYFFLLRIGCKWIQKKSVLKLALYNWIRKTCTFFCDRAWDHPFRPLKWTFPRLVLFFCLDCGYHTTPNVWFHRLSSIQRKFFFLLTILILFCCCCSWLEKCFIDFLLYSKLYSGGILCRISFLNLVP